MELPANGSLASTVLMISSSSSSSKSSSTSSSQAPALFQGDSRATGPMQAWWEGIDTARERLKALQEILGTIASLEALLESERPTKGLLEEETVAQAILSHLCKPSSGHGQDALCQWFYDTFQTGKSDLQAIVLRFIPAICGLYLSRVMNPADQSLAGFEAVLLALYTAEMKARSGRPLVVHIPDLSHPSLYHAPRIPRNSLSEPQIGCVSAALEPQDAVRATKRACIIGVALDLFCRKIAYMPTDSKIEACQCALRWAGLSWSKDQESSDVIESEDSSTICSVGTRRAGDLHHQFESPCTQQVPQIEIVGPGELFLGNRAAALRGSSDHGQVVPVASSSPKWSTSAFQQSIKVPGKPLRPSLQANNSKFDFASALVQAGNEARIQLSRELVQPLFKILGHCLLAPSNSGRVKEAALAAVDALHERACRDLLPEAMLATRSLKRLHMASNAVTNASSNSVSSSSKLCKQDILHASN
ncbi:hypothetical protein GOP47_0027681 [Adiantum capillus-veneris]|nr:hypothetical protein GOP47_0027681 [Adiantum capillus-veneris]